MTGLTPAQELLMKAHTSRCRGKRRGARPKPSAAETFAGQLRLSPLPPAVAELQFAADDDDPRRWRFDFAWPDYMLAAEIEGLIVRKIAGQTVVQGRHATVTGFKEDCLKYARAVASGWAVLRFEQTMVERGAALDLTWQALERRGWTCPA